MLITRKPYFVGTLLVKIICWSSEGRAGTTIACFCAGGFLTTGLALNSSADR